MWDINFTEILSAFLVMFAIIDITGSIPVFLGIKKQNKKIEAGKACGTALVLFVVFFFAGHALLNLFGVDIASFAVAGSVVIFILALEMILNIEIIKTGDCSSGASIVPVAFPLIAGPGAMTTLLSLRAEYGVVNIMIGLVLNIALAYIVLRSIDKVGKFLGNDFVYIVRKLFGVVLLAIAVKLFASNLAIVISSLAVK